MGFWSGKPKQQSQPQQPRHRTWQESYNYGYNQSRTNIQSSSDERYYAYCHYFFEQWNPYAVSRGDCPIPKGDISVRDRTYTAYDGTTVTELQIIVGNEKSVMWPVVPLIDTTGYIAGIKAGIVEYVQAAYRDLAAQAKKKADDAEVERRRNDAPWREH